MSNYDSGFNNNPPSDQSDNSGYGSSSSYDRPTKSSFSSPLDLSGSPSGRPGYPSSGYGTPYGGASGAPVYSGAGADGRDPLTDAGLGHPVGGGTRIDPNYKFNPAEQAVLRECSREAFYYRSLPMMAVFSSAAYVLTKRGVWTAGQYGPWPKVVVAALMGYFGGKASYYKQCEDKFLRLPESRVGEMIRARRAGRTGLPPAPDPSSSYPSWSPSASSQPSPYGGRFGSYEQPATKAPYEQASGMNTDDHFSSLDIDSEKNRYVSGDDSKPSSLDFDVDRPPSTLDDVETQRTQRSTDYDDLRKQHRDAYFRPPPPRGGGSFTGNQTDERRPGYGGR